MKLERLFDVPRYQRANCPQDIAISTKENGAWRAYSINELIDTAERLSVGLMRLGIGAGDKVALTSGNRSEWCLIDQAILQLGATVVPIYPTSSEEDFAYVLNHAEAKICFTSGELLFNKVKGIQAQVPSLTRLFTFDKVDDAPHWSSLIVDPTNEERTKLQQAMEMVKGSDLATLIYTSGTTGRPKGVMLSHDNILSNVRASEPRLPVGAEGVAISFLPLSHIFERMLMYLYLSTGVSIHFQESLEDLGERIREVRPTVFTAVPRLLEKIFDKIMDKGNALTGIKHKLFHWAVDLGLKYDVHGKSPWYHAQLWLARKLIFSKWQEALGGRVRVAASGSAALQPRLARVFCAAGIPIMEGYGLTETSPVVTVNAEANDGLRFGSVGKPIEHVQVKIADDGEILVKGPNVMQGYYKDPERTAEVMDNEGWFHTGDIGEIDKDGFLKITDRKKEIFKTSGGKYVAPQVIENILKESRFIEQVMVIGENRKFPSALIIPSFDFLKEYATRKGITFTSREQVVQDERIVKRIQEEVDACNKHLGHWEQIKRPTLLAREWTIDAGELTPTLKLRRKVILEHSKDIIAGIYGEA